MSTPKAKHKYIYVKTYQRVLYFFIIIIY